MRWTLAPPTDTNHNAQLALRGADMLIAAVNALAELAREPVPASVLKAYKLKKLKFGPDYILPKPFDPRLADRVPKAVAQAARRGKSGKRAK